MSDELQGYMDGLNDPSFVSRVARNSTYAVKKYSDSVMEYMKNHPTLSMAKYGASTQVQNKQALLILLYDAINNANEPDKVLLQRYASTFPDQFLPQFTLPYNREGSSVHETVIKRYRKQAEEEKDSNSKISSFLFGLMEQSSNFRSFDNQLTVDEHLRKPSILPMDASFDQMIVKADNQERWNRFSYGPSILEYIAFLHIEKLPDDHKYNQLYMTLLFSKTFSKSPLVNHDASVSMYIQTKCLETHDKNVDDLTERVVRNRLIYKTYEDELKIAENSPRRKMTKEQKQVLDERIKVLKRTINDVQSTLTALEMKLERIPYWKELYVTCIWTYAVFYCGSNQERLLCGIPSNISTFTLKESLSIKTWSKLDMFLGHSYSQLPNVLISCCSYLMTMRQACPNFIHGSFLASSIFVKNKDTSCIKVCNFMKSICGELLPIPYSIDKEGTESSVTQTTCEYFTTWITHDSSQSKHYKLFTYWYDMMCLLANISEQHEIASFIVADCRYLVDQKKVAESTFKWVEKLVECIVGKPKKTRKTSFWDMPITKFDDKSLSFLSKVTLEDFQKVCQTLTLNEIHYKVRNPYTSMY